MTLVLVIIALALGARYAMTMDAHGGVGKRKAQLKRVRAARWAYGKATVGLGVLLILLAYDWYVR
jgi:hypothetical protein